MKMYLMVYYVDDLLRSKGFFENIGFSFVEEMHGNGPRHYAAKIGGTVFEIYPSGKSGILTRSRIGFDLSEGGPPSDEVVSFIKESSDSFQCLDDGKVYAVLTDPNKNKVELYW